MKHFIFQINHFRKTGSLQAALHHFQNRVIGHSNAHVYAAHGSTVGIGGGDPQFHLAAGSEILFATADFQVDFEPEIGRAHV